MIAVEYSSDVIKAAVKCFNIENLTNSSEPRHAFPQGCYDHLGNGQYACVPDDNAGDIAQPKEGFGTLKLVHSCAYDYISGTDDGPFDVVIVDLESGDGDGTCLVFRIICTVF